MWACVPPIVVHLRYGFIMFSLSLGTAFLLTVVMRMYYLVVSLAASVVFRVCVAGVGVHARRPPPALKRNVVCVTAMSTINARVQNELLQVFCIRVSPSVLSTSNGDNAGQPAPLFIEGIHFGRKRTDPISVQHYLWAAGHFVLLVSSLRYFLASITFRGVSAWWYKSRLLF